MIIDYTPKRINIKGYKYNDCTVNAFGTALGVSYDLSRKFLQTGIYNPQLDFDFLRRSPKTKAQFVIRTNVLRLCEAISVDKNIIISEKERKEKLNSSKRRYKGLGDENNSVAKFAESNPEGVFILLTHGHLLTVINGKIIDTWDSSKLAVEIAFKIDVEHGRKVIKDMAKYYGMDKPAHYADNIGIVEKKAKAKEEKERTMTLEAVI